MADFKTITDLINLKIVTNGEGLIDAITLRDILLGMLTAVGDNLDGKANISSTYTKNDVDAMLNNKFDKALGINLQTKVDAMPNITNYDAANDRITIGSKTYQLTEYVPIPDYYVGWTTGNKAAFNALNDSQITELAGQGKYILSSPTYTRAFGTDTIFFLLYKSNTIPSKIIFTSSNQPMQQDIVSDNNFASHADVEIGGTKYKLFGIYMSGGDPTDSITIQYQ